MPVVKLSAFVIQTTVCPPGKNKVVLYDESVTGFVAEIRAGGGATYALRYRDEHGSQKQYRIGNVNDLSFDRAKREAVKLRSRVVVGDDPAIEKKQKRSVPTFAELAIKYLAHVRTYQRDPATAERHMRLRLVKRWGKMRLTEIHQTDVAEWFGELAAQELKPATIERTRVIFSHAFKLAKQWGIHGAETNPIVGIARPPLNNAIERYLTTEEVERLRAAVEGSKNTQLKYIVGLLLLTGARVSELLNSKWTDFDLDRQTWRIGLSKTGRSRHVPLSKAAVEIIGQMPRFADCPFLVPNPSTKLPFRGVFVSWDNARKAAGLPDVRIHTLRHSAASFMINGGIDLFTVGRVLGHANHKTTMRYSHLANDTLVKAVEAGAAKIGLDWAATANAVRD